MRIVVQRVSEAKVLVDSEIAGEIGVGLLLLVGVEESDGPGEVEAAAKKVSTLRVFPDTEGLMNRSVLDIGGSALVVSQFTLLGDVRKGRRPSFTKAGNPELANRLVDELVQALRAEGVPTESGRFGAKMEVSLVNDGPVTLVVDIKDQRVL